jgi:predicted 3-demethylubiquinone-9 3-methyltransferase (glyoxalase superfamily)
VEETAMQKVTPFLWFDTQAEEAMNYYVSIFKNSKALSVNKANGKVMTVEFELDGQRFIGLNAGPMFKFNEAVSFYVNCETQEEVDTLWEQLSAGGEKSQCGWVKDKFGLWWQVIPGALRRLMGDSNPRKSAAVFQAMMQMKKIVTDDLQKAYDSTS